MLTKRAILLMSLFFLIGCFVIGCAPKEPLPPSWTFKTSFVNHSPTIGNTDAPIKIEVFSDFACKHCKKGSEIAKELLLEYPGQVYVVYKHMLLRTEGKSMNAAKAARAASVQDRFWDMHDAIYKYGRKLSKSEVYHLASLLGLEMTLFNEAVSYTHLTLPTTPYV